ncbi:hypothetical protein ACFQMF_11990 [Halorubrum rutilum]|uniref:Uncharacterized protein n=1 Tax=Halorubrum rutilum TaxID=1364933 RepID=A0ABD6AMB6_9EURY|nr:hypothetical protein [Halorubrum rutilum]
MQRTRRGPLGAGIGLVAGFSGDAWEERTGRQGRLADGWAVV